MAEGARWANTAAPLGTGSSPKTSIRKTLSSAGQRAGLGHVRPHELRHTFVTRMLDLSVLIERVNYLAGHKSKVDQALRPC